MPSLFKPIAVFFFLLALRESCLAQDSTGGISWKAEAKKIGEGKYELSFVADSLHGWEVYAPNQKLLETKTVELKFIDSSVQQQGDFIPGLGTKKIKSSIFENTLVDVYNNSATWKMNIIINGTVPAHLQDTLFYAYGKEETSEFYTAKIPFAIALEGGVESTARILIPTIDIKHPAKDCGDAGTKGKSIFTIFIFGLLGGFIALLTPCVFPMIPLTVSFFTKKTGNKKRGAGNAILYGFFIFLIYVLLTVPFHVAGKTNPEIFNNISTSVLLNLIFFVVFVIFALSFFGLFELTLPSGVAGRIDSKSSIRSWGGIFFMALTLAIVSFSCTGPILGTLLAGVADQGAWPLTAGAAGFGIALGLPFALFAMFPHWLKSIPKSGGWLTDVKVVLGFIELALAVKFLANADNVKQWGFLKREIFIGLWFMVAVMVVLYLTGLIKMAHSSPVKKFSKTRIAFTLLFAAAAVYLAPGITNTKSAKLALISGFPPPLCYSIYKKPVNCDKPLLDYEQALKLARKENKPVLIDFTGWACVNCRKMEEKVWTKPSVEKMMHNDFILVSLYVDERTKLPTSQQLVYKAKNGSDKSIITIGDKWSAFQIDNFDATSQPQYAIVSPDEKALVKTKFYTPDPKEFADWLQCGLDTFKKNKQ